MTSHAQLLCLTDKWRSTSSSCTIWYQLSLLLSSCSAPTVCSVPIFPGSVFIVHEFISEKGNVHSNIYMHLKNTNLIILKKNCHDSKKTQPGVLFIDRVSCYSLRNIFVFNSEVWILKNNKSFKVPWRYTETGLLLLCVVELHRVPPISCAPVECVEGVVSVTVEYYFVDCVKVYKRFIEWHDYIQVLK